MRRLDEIMEDLVSGGEPSYEELYYSLLVYRFMFNMDHDNLRKELMKEKSSNKMINEMKAQNSHDMVKSALESSPKEYLGWKNDPKNPEYQERIKMANKIFENFITKRNG